MKLTALLLTLGFVHVFAGTHAQKITLSGKDLSYEKIFAAIEKQTGFVAFGDKELLAGKKTMSLTVYDLPLKDLLDIIFKGQPFVYDIQGKTVFISPKKERSEEEGMVIKSLVEPISGLIRDSVGQPLSGATIVNKKNKKTVQSNARGEFTIEAEEGDVLLLSFVGYESQSIRVSGSRILAILKRSSSPLDEVQIIAYGTTTRRYSTGNVSTVKAKDIENNVVSDPILALKGRVPGLMIQQTRGIPGAEVKINIRGLNSFVNGTQPLVLIDGIPMDANLSTLGGGVRSLLTLINPGDIESIDVLKDADATAIYGSRGANGVILITTKKGRSGAAKIDLKMQHGIGEVAQRRDLMNTEEYLMMRKEALANDGITPQIDASYLPGYAPDLLLWDQNKYTDWQKEFLGTAQYTNLQSSISGGGSNYNYLISGNYNRETTVFPGDSKFQTGRIRFSLSNTSSNGKFRSLLSGGYSSDKSFMPGVDFISFFDLPPNAPYPFNDDGTLNWAINPKTGNTTWPDNFNPYSKVRNEAVENKGNSLIGNIDLSYKLFTGLEAKITAGISQFRSDGFNQVLIDGVEPIYRSVSTAQGTYRNAKDISWQLEPLMTYTVRGSKGDLSVMVGSTMLSRSRISNHAVASGIRDDAYVRNPLSGSNFRVHALGSEYRYTAYYGRVSYVLADRYLINGTIRTDGSSRFGPNRQFKQFGALGAGWVFSKESFIEDNLPFLSFGKLRASWGVTGNDQIRDYAYLDTYSFTPNVGDAIALYQGVRPIAVTGLFNPDYGWERTTKLEVALELGILKERIVFNASWYKNKSDNQLLSNQLPLYVGFESVIGNLEANMDNVGQEYSLTTRNITTKDFDWSTTLNVSIQKNRVISYNSQLLKNDLYEKLANEKRSIATQPVFRMTSLDPETGTFRFIDYEGKEGGALPADPIAALIDESPKYFGGFQNNFRYKQFQLDVFFQFVKQIGKNTRYNNERGLIFMPGTMHNQDRYVIRRWQKPGDITDVRKYTTNYDDQLSVMDYDRFLVSEQNYGDASYIRCTNLSISYGIPKKMLSKLGLVNCRFYLQGQNLFTITRYKGWDPETRSVSSIPALRIITGGIQISL